MDVNASADYDGVMSAETTGPRPVAGPGLGFDPIAEARRQWVEQGWPEAADGMAAVTSLMRAHQIVLARVDAALKPLGVTFARYEVLMLLWFSKRGSLPMKVIGSRLQVHPTSVTNAVDRLEDAGLVDPVDAPRPTAGPSSSRSPPSAAARRARRPRPSTPRCSATPDLSSSDVSSLVDVLTRLRRDAGDF